MQVDTDEVVSQDEAEFIQQTGHLQTDVVGAVAPAALCRSSIVVGLVYLSEKRAVRIDLLSVIALVPDRPPRNLAR
jgi:hypothetical protein